MNVTQSGKIDFVQVKWSTAGLHFKMLQLCKVTNALFISNARSACNDDLIQQEEVTLCINVSRQQPFPVSHVGVLRVPVYDDPNENLYRYFDRCADAIADEAARGGHSVVYCKNGRSRSATICVAYLMKHRQLSLANAFQVGGAVRLGGTGERWNIL